MDSAAHLPVMPTTTAPAAPRPVATPTAVLTRALRDGDEAAWREFHAAYAPRLLRYLLVVCAGQEDAAREALQQTFLRSVKHIRTIATEAELWSWLTVLARSAAADAGRRERRYLGFLERWFRERPEPPAINSDPEQELAAALAAELAMLPAADRELLERKYLDGDAIRALAATLGTSEKAVESRLTRARQRLKDGLLNRLRHASQV